MLPKYNIIVRSFCNYVVRCIRKEVRKHARIPALQLRVNTMLTEELIQWIDRKPDSLSAVHVLNLIVQNIHWGKVKNRYIIEVDPEVLFPGSITPLALVARYLNYGSLRVKGCFFISNVFRKYQEGVYKLYLMYKLKIQR